MLKRFSTAWTALLLWILTMVVGIYEISVIRDLSQQLYTWLASQEGTALQRYGRSYWNGVTIGTAAVMIRLDIRD